LKSILFNGTPYHQKSEDELMQHYFELWRENQKRDSGVTSNASNSHAVISKERFRRMYTIPFAEQNDNPLQASKLSVKSINEESPSFSLVQNEAASDKDRSKRLYNNSRKSIPEPDKSFDSRNGNERALKGDAPVSKDEKSGQTVLKDSTSPRFSLKQTGASNRTLADGTPRVSAETAMGEMGLKKELKESSIPVKDSSKPLVGNSDIAKVVSEGTSIGKDKLVNERKQAPATSNKTLADGTPRVSVETAVEESGKKPILKVSDTAAKSLADVSKIRSSSTREEKTLNEVPTVSLKDTTGKDRKQTISPRSSQDQHLENASGSNQSAFLTLSSDQKTESSNQTSILMPANSAPQLVDRGQHELVLTWDPWIISNAKSKLSSSSIEYSLDWKEGKGPGGHWNSIPAVLKTCETRKRNLTPSSWYSFRVRARLVNIIMNFQNILWSLHPKLIGINPCAQVDGSWTQFGEIASVKSCLHPIAS
jgi:hypothetical protein